MSKKTGQLSTHVSDEVARQIRSLAHFAGTTSSEYIADLLEQHLAEKQRVYQDMHQIFGPQSSMSSIRTEESDQ